MDLRLLVVFVVPSVFVLGVLVDPTDGETDSPDVSALNVLYKSLNSPSQLTGWKSSGGDPCGKSWKGITCSGSSVTEINLSGLGLSGTLGYQLSSLASVTHFDLSKNNLHGDIPYQLPPSTAHINLAGNAFTGGIPYSISEMTDLETLKLANNQLNGQVSDMFGKLPNLSELDLSFNRFSGNLPESFRSLKGLKTLYLQNSQFSGSVAVLASLNLDNLNIQNNHFTGWIPDGFRNIGNFQAGGNSWSSSQPPPHYHLYDNDKDNRSSGAFDRKSSVLKGLAIGGSVVAVLLFVVAVLAIMKKKSATSVHYIDECGSQGRSFTPLVSHEKDFKSMGYSAAIDVNVLQRTTSLGLKSISSGRNSSFSENEFKVKFNSKRCTDPINASAMLLVDLQAATGGFSANRLLGEGSIGHVYKAKYADRKVLAVKKVDSTCIDFMEVISEISRLHHPNISELVGFCSESGYNLLVYEYERNGSLHDYLHLSDDFSKPLTWDTRVRIALGTARAVEYLHEVCSPFTIHKNIKSSNILLDIELNPHLSDCGLASFYEDPGKNLGLGYQPPEYSKPSDYTVKGDVYCFGVVMLELLTGRKPFDSTKPKAEQSLVRWATPQLHNIDALARMVDPALRGLYPPKSLSRLADVIALCVQPEPEFRPPMSEVVQALVLCVQRSSINKKMGGELSSSRRSDDSDYYY
ncbi:Protein strubbelig-receptor family 5 [Apostasia shenzhenica]|uniref:Protein strubbelig-receptor family 5 n=1 Tax=Apostasia shenzhenica TaxID=1088818 RepID=A0A2I0ABN0_9ASPA|nr:Protein strubbelig-receptor family 5 [Apostasia shenzhenica]